MALIKHYIKKTFERFWCKMKYSKHYIEESIRFWKKQRDQINENHVIDQTVISSIEQLIVAYNRVYKIDSYERKQLYDALLNTILAIVHGTNNVESAKKLSDFMHDFIFDEQNSNVRDHALMLVADVLQSIKK